ncbi:MAG: OmpA family protein, partial [Cyclobacteriaceae bacterium]|nr:OmpA family protein [Cyclobacteriaceae bacterium]
VMNEGKFVTRGILFDVNKATLKRESMGVINQVVKLMQDHQDLSFSIEGHTDNDGDEAYNLKLSAQRAAAVKQALIAQGITADRLQTAGKGETVPLDTNATPEGKANNRRVEFVKL